MSKAISEFRTGTRNEDLHLFSIFIETLSPYGTMYSDSTAF